MHSSGHKYHYLINVEDPQMALGYLATCLPNNKEHRAVAACRSCSFTILQTRLSLLNQRSCTITYIDQSQTNFSVMNQEFIQFSERQNQNDQQSILILTYIFHIYGHQAIKPNQVLQTLLTLEKVNNIVYMVYLKWHSLVACNSVNPCHDLKKYCMIFISLKQANVWKHASLLYLLYILPFFV